MFYVLEILVRNSIEACLIAGVILLIKGIAGKRISPQIHYGIWGVFLVKLALPVRYSIPVRQMGAAYQQHIVQIPETVSFGSAELVPDVQPVLQQNAIGFPFLLEMFLILLYFIVLVALLLILVVSYLRTVRNLRRSGIEKQHGIRVCYTEDYETPFLFGILHPVAVLPKACETAGKTEQIACMIAHEATHAKRKDHLVSIALYILRCVYWFNPLMWFLCSKIRRDMELACDASVVKSYSAEQKRSYATALVEAAGSRTPAAVAGFAEKQFRGRIQNVLSGRTYSKTSRTVALVLIVLLSAGSFIGAGSAAPQLPHDFQNALEQLVAARRAGEEDVETLVRMLPAPDPLYQFDRLSWQGEKDAVVLYSINEEEMYQGGYLESNLACNAILLFAGTQQLNTVTFVLREELHTFERADLETIYGKLYQMKKKELTRICYANRHISEERMHVDRIRWGSNEEMLIGRWSAPSQRLHMEDGIDVLLYHMTGVQVTYPDGTTEQEIGEDITCHLRNGKVYQIDTSGGGEFSYNLDVSADMSPQELFAALGTPTEISHNTYLYGTDNGHYVYFTYQGGKMTQLGLCESK